MFKQQITPDAKHEAIIFHFIFFFTFEPINVCLCVPALFFCFVLFEIMIDFLSLSDHQRNYLLWTLRCSAAQTWY